MLICNFILVFTSRKREQRAMWLRDFYHCSSGMAAGFRTGKQRVLPWAAVVPILCLELQLYSHCWHFVRETLYCAYSTAFARLRKLGNKIWKSFNSTYHDSFIQFGISSSSKHVCISGEDQRLQEHYSIVFQVSFAESKP